MMETFAATVPCIMSEWFVLETIHIEQIVTEICCSNLSPTVVCTTLTLFKFKWTFSGPNLHMKKRKRWCWDSKTQITAYNLHKYTPRVCTIIPRKKATWAAVRTVFAIWFDRLEESFSYKVQFRKSCPLWEPVVLLSPDTLHHKYLQFVHLTPKSLMEGRCPRSPGAATAITTPRH